MSTAVARLFRGGQLSAFVVYVGFVAIIGFFAIALSDRGFMTPENMMTIIRQTTPVTIMAVGMTFALCAGQIDLSVGATVALAALVTAVVMREAGLALAIPAGLLTGALVGLVNGLLTVALRIPALLVTLGTMGIITGLARVLTNLESVPITSDPYTFVFGSGDIGPVSVLFVWTVAALAIGHLALNNTAHGRRVLATGGEVQAARAAGISTMRVTIGVFVVTGMAAALAGMLYAGRLHGARYTLGETDVLTVIAAVVIGGTSLFGGKGSVIGAVVGSWLLGVLNNGLILMGFSVSDQMIARGVILILAVAISLRETRQ
ncbi:ribose transport system permease protein [Inquilinus ginsengisoli]|uniref:Ribose transport system permease protein n=1 Tax=Inquilinus ginsengisoli TaxID=363840 RepID=A0ABU1K0N5_9PROT|nr:ABC transporter permease [Inquilinus ginsengisoli]MDR6294431.1 ribose transport system permease protein [Inquilinus ginsengisoli]